MRCENFLSFMNDEINLRYEEIYKKVEKAYQENAEKTESSFIQKMDELFMRCYKKQLEGVKKSIKYIMIYPLKMGFLGGSYEVMVSLLDIGCYDDRKEVSTYWIPEYLIPVIKEEREYYEKSLEKQFIRVMEYEKKDALRCMFEEYYFKPLKEFFEGQIENCKRLESYHTMQKEEDIVFLYGNYMDEMDELAE